MINPKLDNLIYSEKRTASCCYGCKEADEMIEVTDTHTFGKEKNCREGKEKFLTIVTKQL